MENMTLASWLQVFSCLSLGLIVCWAMISVILKRAERKVGTGRGRDFHHGQEVPIPRVGGIALVSAFFVVTLAIWLCTPLSPANVSILGIIVFSCLAMFALGLRDDIRPLSAKFKLAVQIAIASLVYWSNIRIELFKNPFTGLDMSLGFYGYFATVLWLVALTNLINLIDGIDGLAGGICLMLMLLLANLGVADNLGFSMLLSVGVAGALMGFLKFNYPPAKIYMGDGGAYFLGFLIGILSIVNANKGTVAAALIAPAFALALPIVDVSLAVLRRAARGLPIFRPDQKHIHHHLLTLGISRERTLLNLYTVSLLCLFLALCVLCLQGRLLPLYTGLLVAMLLIAGHLSGFTKNWYQISSQLGQSLRLRRETRYALTLDRWLVLEAARCESIDEFWEDYRFCIRKLGFESVRLTVADNGIHAWQSEDLAPQEIAVHRAVHEIGRGTFVELTVSKARMSEELFTLLGDLAAETWYKAAPLCQAKARRTASIDQRKIPELKGTNFTPFEDKAPLDPATLRGLANP